MTEAETFILLYTAGLPVLFCVFYNIREAYRNEDGDSLAMLIILVLLSPMWLILAGGLTIFGATVAIPVAPIFFGSRWLIKRKQTKELTSTYDFT